MVIPLHKKFTLILVVVCFFIERFADCCNRTPARPPVAPPAETAVTGAPPEGPPEPSPSPRPTPATTSGETSAPTEPPRRTHRLPCTGPEINSTACLNKGTCFAVILQNTRQAFCRCPQEYSGRRCQDAQLPPGISIDDMIYPIPRIIESSTYSKTQQLFSMENVRTANIATGAIVTIIILVVILLSLYGYVRWRKKTRQSQTTTGEQMTRASSVRSINGVDAIRNPALNSSHRSSQYSISSHPALSKSKESLDPGGFFSSPPVNGASYYTMQDVHAPSWSPSPARTPERNGERTSPWLHRHRSYSRNSGRPMRHSATDSNVINSSYKDWRLPARSPSETTV